MGPLQRVAAAKPLGDCTFGGDLDLTLAVADGARGGMADPAFQAHLKPIVAWAQAVWASHLPRSEKGPRPRLSMHELSLSMPEAMLSPNMLILAICVEMSGMLSGTFSNSAMFNTCLMTEGWFGPPFMELQAAPSFIHIMTVRCHSSAFLGKLQHANHPTKHLRMWQRGQP